jgi:hypothetical protein
LTSSNVTIFSPQGGLHSFATPSPPMYDITFARNSAGLFWMTNQIYKHVKGMPK